MNTSGGPTFGDFFTILTDGSMQDNTPLQDYRVQEYRLLSPPSIKCNVLRGSLSEDSQNIPCTTLKRRGVLGNLCISLLDTYDRGTAFSVFRRIRSLF
jgi:hypothetical protein